MIKWNCFKRIFFKLRHLYVSRFYRNPNSICDSRNIRIFTYKFICTFNLVSNLYDLKTSSLLIDISLHLGSLLAIIFFFRKDLFDLKNNQKLLSLIIVGSIPLIIFGYILHTTELIHLLRNIKVIAWTTLFFGIILYFADQRKLIKIYLQT